jgi:hypothetical protein
VLCFDQGSLFEALHAATDKNYSDAQIKQDEMGGAYGTYEIKVKYIIYRIFVEKPKERDHLEDIGMNGSIILKWVLSEIGRKGMDCIHLVQQKDKLWATVKTVMDLRSMDSKEF